MCQYHPRALHEISETVGFKGSNFLHTMHMVEDIVSPEEKQMNQ